MSDILQNPRIPRVDGDMERNTRWRKFLSVLVFIILSVGCWGVSNRQAPSTMDLLRRSGFQPYPPKNPDHLQNLPGYQFVTVQWQGRTIYVYAEPKSKQMYFGSEQAYFRYKANVAAARTAEAQQAPPSAQPSMGLLDWDLYADIYRGLD